MTCGIYRIYNRVNNKSYVGLSKNIEKRIDKHFYDLQHNIHHNRDMQKVYNNAKEYKVSIFDHEVLEQCSPDILQEREIEWIQHYDSYKNGYNRTSGGELGSSRVLSYPYFKYLYDDRYSVDYNGFAYFSVKNRFDMIRLHNLDEQIDDIDTLYRVNEIYFNVKKQYICLNIHETHERPFTSYNKFQFNFHNLRFLEYEVSLPLDDYVLMACKNNFDLQTNCYDIEYYQITKWDKSNFNFQYHGENIFDKDHLNRDEKRNNFIGLIV